MSEVGCDNLVAVFPKPGKRAVAVFKNEAAASCALQIQLPQAYSHWKLESIATPPKQSLKSAGKENNTRMNSPKSTVTPPKPSNVKSQLQHAAQDCRSKSPSVDRVKLQVGPVREVSNDNHYEARKAVFVSNISSEELRRNLSKAFAHIGPVDKVIPTSNRSAVVVFPEQRMARNALFQNIPAPFQALHVTEARDYQPRGFRAWRGGAQTSTDGNPHRSRNVSSQRTDSRYSSGSSITSEIIRSDWDRNERGIYVLGTKRLDRHLANESPPLICQNVPADGNCGWWAAIRAGNLPFNHPQELKGYVLEFWKMNRAHILDAVCVHNVDSWTADLENNLKTNGAFIDQPSWQILAWMLERDIVIWDVFRCTRTTVEGSRPWAIKGSTQPILVAHRDDET